MWESVVLFVAGVRRSLSVLCAVVLVSACGGSDSDDAVGDRVIAQQVVGPSGGVMAVEDGPIVEVPPGAVTAATGITMTIGASDARPTLPEGFEQLGVVWDVGPTGTVVVEPLRITMPIPPDVDPSEVLGLVTQDASGAWVGVPATVDVQARTVTGRTNHLSPFGVLGGRAEAARTGGWVRVVNPYVRGSASFPGGRNLPMHRENLICFTATAPTTPALLVPPSWGVVVATPSIGPSSASTTGVVEYWLPAGSYTVEEGIFASEINTDPGYSPVVRWWTKAPSTFVVTPGSTTTFESFPSVPPDGGSGFAEGPNTCARTWSPLAATTTTTSSTSTTTSSTTTVPLPPPTVEAQLPAAWDFVCAGIVSPHEIVTLDMAPDGTFTGTGRFTQDDAYTWDLSGTVTGNTVTWSVTYTGNEAGFVYSGTGTVDPDGSMRSDVDPNVNGCTAVTTAAGVFS